MEKALLFIDSLSQHHSFTYQNELLYFDTLNSIAIENNLKAGQQDIYRRQAAIYMNIGDLNNSISCYLKSLKISDEINDTFAYWSTKANIGGVYIHFKLFEKAKENIIPALKYYETNNSSYSSAIWSYNLSQVYFELKDFEIAEKLASNALLYKLKIRKEWITYKADSLDYAINLIHAFAAIKPDSAKRLFIQYEPWIYNEKDSIIKSSSYAYGANLFGKLDIIEAKKYYESSKQYFAETINPDTKKEIFKDYKEYFQKTKQFDSAYKYAELCKVLNDSFYNSEKLKIVANSTNLYELLGNKEIKLLKAQKQTVSAWLVGLSFGLCLLISLGFYIYKNQQNKGKRILAETNLNINKILDEVNQTKMEAWADGQEKERSRLAAELHDRLGGLLVMVSHHFTGIEKKFDSIKRENEKTFADFRKMINSAIMEVRELSKDISSNLVSKLGLPNAMLDLKEKIETATLLKVNLNIHNANAKVPLTSEIALFRIAQEALNNVMKHAEATEIQLSLTGNELSLILMIEDNGKGFDAFKTPDFSGMGLKSMQKRMVDIGGRLNVDSKIGRGTVVVAEVGIVKTSEV